MSRIKYALLGLILIGIAGCGGTSTEDRVLLQEDPAAEPRAALEEAPQVSEPAPASPAPASPAPSKTTKQAPMDVTEAIKANPEPVRPVVEQQPAPQVRQVKSITIPAGTAIEVRLQDPLDSSVNQSGDTFGAILDQDIDLNGNIVASRGSLLQGELSNVAQSGRTKGRATMSLRLVNLEIGDQSYPMQTEVLAFEAEPTKKEDATKVGIGAGIGAVIGAIAGGGKGAAIGAAVGGGAGGATVLATRGKELEFEAERKFSFVLSEDVGVRVE